MHYSSPFKFWLVSLLALLSSSAAAGGRAGVPRPLANLLEKAGFSKKDIQDVNDGKLVKTIWEASNEREIAMNFAFLLKDTSLDRIKELFLTLGKKKIVDPDVVDFGFIVGDGTLQDFENVKLEPNGCEAAEAYMNVEPGSDMNLSKEEIASFRALKDKDDSSSGTNNNNKQQRVEERLREMLLARYRAYRTRGLSGIFPYARERNKNYRPGDELLHKTNLSRLLQSEAPTLYRYLQDYPKSKPKDDKIDETFAWITYANDERPAVALSHRLVLLHDGNADSDDDDNNKAYVFCERHYYNSRAYNSVQSIGMALPLLSTEQDNKEHDQIGTTTAVCVLLGTKTSTDLITGLGGSAKRAIGSRMLGSMVEQQLQALQQSEANDLKS